MATRLNGAALGIAVRVYDDVVVTIMEETACTEVAWCLYFRPLPMALPFDTTTGPADPRAVAILAKTIYRELRSSGYSEKDVLALAGELLGMVTTDLQGRRPVND